MSDETNLYFNLDDEDNEKRVVVRVSELVRCLKHFRESLLCNGGDYEHDMREIGGHLKATTLGSGTLTAEQVSNAVYAHSIHADCADADWQAIADELNARAERTCEFKPFKSGTNEEGERQGICSVCSAYMHEQFCFCPNCGCKVVDV